MPEWNHGSALKSGSTDADYHYGIDEKTMKYSADGPGQKHTQLIELCPAENHRCGVDIIFQSLLPMYPRMKR